MIYLTDNHFKLFELIQNRGIGRICNDLNPDEEALLSAEERQELCKAYWELEKEPENYNPEHPFILDFMVVDVVYKILKLTYIDYNNKGWAY